MATQLDTQLVDNNKLQMSDHALRQEFEISRPINHNTHSKVLPQNININSTPTVSMIFKQAMHMHCSIKFMHEL